MVNEKSKTKVELTAEAMRKAEENLIVALELNSPGTRRTRLELIRVYGDCLIRHHNAIEEAKRNSVVNYARAKGGAQ